MYNDFSVPTLSLSSSRAKKQYNTAVPTKDYTQKVAISPYPQASDYINEPKKVCRNHIHIEQQQERVKRNHIFPPRPPSPKNEIGSKDINKNVYLQSPQIPNINSTNFQFSYQQQPLKPFENPKLTQALDRTSSSKGLLTNPESTKMVQQQVKERIASRKVDASKMLFDRKLAKLFSQANFYDQQLMQYGKDDLTDHFDELISMKNEHIASHRDLIEGLTSLIK